MIKNGAFFKSKTMKKVSILFSLFILLTLGASAQNLEYESAIRNSQSIFNGSARFMGMGGAFTALGGDISSLSVNPAGIGVYSGMQIVATPAMQYNKTNTNMLGQAASENEYKINFHNLGLIASYDIQEESRWKKFNFGIGYNQTMDFNNSFNTNYFNTDHSLMDTYLDNAQSGNLRSDYEELAFQTYLLNDYYIDNNQDTIYEWWSPVTDGMNNAGVNQDKYITKKGANGEYFISLGGNYADKLYIGATFGIQRVNYEITQVHHESEVNDQMYDFHSFDFTEYENHTGAGYNLKVGAIYKPTNYIRLGAAIHSPTFYNLEYTWYNRMSSQFDNGDNFSYESDSYTFSYNLITPMRIETGAAWQIKDVGLISVDYERIDYASSKLESSGTVMTEYSPQEVKSDNDSISNTLTAANNLRFGGEVKLGSFYLRGGYALYQSPYNSTYSNRKSNTQIYSGGLGYREGSFFIDATFMQSMFTEEKYLHDSVYEIFNETTEIERKRNKIILTFGLRF